MTWKACAPRVLAGVTAKTTPQAQRLERQPQCHAARGGRIEQLIPPALRRGFGYTLPMWKTMWFGINSGIGIVVHAKTAPAGAEWQQMLDAMEVGFAEKTLRGIVVYTLGGAPNPVQRKALASLYERHGNVAKVAVVTPNPAIRAVVGLLNWLTRDPLHKVFAPNDEANTKRFVGISDAEWPLVRAVIDREVSRLDAKAAA